MDIDLGDAVLRTELIIKGLHRTRITVRVGVPVNTTPADRVIKGPPYATTPERIGVRMDLQADKKVTLAIDYTDEVGNAVPTPADAAATFAVDDPTIINLTDNGDGTAVAAAVGTLGTANVHVTASSAGATLTGDLQIIVVAGLAERINITAGAPEEATPDTP